MKADDARDSAHVPLEARLHWIELLSLLVILGVVAFAWDSRFV